jgi:hypothetical protein
LSCPYVRKWVVEKLPVAPDATARVKPTNEQWLSARLERGSFLNTIGKLTKSWNFWKKMRRERNVHRGLLRLAKTIEAKKSGAKK